MNTNQRKWAVQPKNDRLKRYSVIQVSDPGRGKQIIADNIRNIQDAHKIAAALDIYEFLTWLYAMNGNHMMMLGEEVTKHATEIQFKAEGAYYVDQS